MTATLDERTETLCSVCERELDPEWIWWTRDGGEFCSIDCLLSSEVPT